MKLFLLLSIASYSLMAESYYTKISPISSEKEYINPQEVWQTKP